MQPECITFNLAENFLDAISPRSSYFDLPLPGQYIFRGQGDATWRLTPSLFRPETYLRVKDKWQLASSLEGVDHIKAEIDTMRIFFRIADENGLVIPEDSYALRHEVVEQWYEMAGQRGYELHKWPPGNVLSILALMQHHGLPTRLLDWSFKSKIAAFFAAKYASVESVQSHELRDTKFLCVWSVDIYSLTREDKLRQNRPNEFTRVELVETAKSVNLNMRAQHGAFTISRPKRSDTDRHIVDRRPVDEIFQEHLLSMKLRCFLLPWRESGKLLRLLAKEYISSATVFPGFAGAAQSVVEQRAWDVYQ